MRRASAYSLLPQGVEARIGSIAWAGNQPDSTPLTKQSLTNGKQRVHFVNAALLTGGEFDPLCSFGCRFCREDTVYGPRTTDRRGGAACTGLRNGNGSGGGNLCFRSHWIARNISQQHQ